MEKCQGYEKQGKKEELSQPRGDRGAMTMRHIMSWERERPPGDDETQAVQD